ncbi:xanthine dehydrogenase family protein molybdopterin-binding subunit [Actinacidiphila sp. DG2A-62]|uniref:xanthine dehydrogenase family protein molybdopterin-binding subunit n=1 Tax=Actinacidiphila sp. DG2A-62 TaxID=3108821 RepID=UPI002DB9D666|nr:xanthine dehydrogenase family protein molybdopterin-binding subunit [Actinacidiphila sp. DG2A-62]MEC3993772.1 xanthine dehydrogenase family protein molybdopterin-binding subunit [Actinacidiphila sp. DG2A-62]
MTATSPVGHEISRVDGRAKVTGTARYAADQRVDGTAYGYLVQSAIGLGSISSMDTARALAAPGVIAVYTPFNPLTLYARQGDSAERYVPLQDDTVRFRGQIIGLVVAESFEQARDAAVLVRTRYREDLRPRTSVAAAAPGSTVPSDAVGYPGPPSRNSVLAPGVASIDDALRDSAVVVESTFYQDPQNHCAMEPHATIAEWRDGRLTVYVGAQGPQQYAAALAGRLGVASDRVHVVSPFVGGGFGGKYKVWNDALVTAAAARDLGRPVKLVTSREQVFVLNGHRPALLQTVKLGASRDGVLNAVWHETDSEDSVVGYCPNLPAEVTRGLYKTPNLHFDQRQVTLDLPPVSSMRAPWATPGTFALETAMDELAVRTGVDPLTLRMRNYATTSPETGRPWSSKHLDECYRVGAERFGWADRSPVPGAHVDGEWLVGMGMASGMLTATRAPASARVRLCDDGTVTVASAISDLGTGATTMLAIAAADALGVPLTNVSAELGDSALPAGVPAIGSIVTGSTVPAVQAAARDAITALIALAVQDPASPFHGKNSADVHYREGRLEAGGRSIGFAPLLRAVGDPAVEAVATTAPGAETNRYAMDSFAAHFCEVRVNRFTGEPRVSRFTTVVDVGRVVNAKALRSQLVGGVVFGIGNALLEVNAIEDSGRLAHSSLADYLVPVNADIPAIDTHWLDHPDTVFSAFGSRGAGELTAVGSSAAVGNAVYNATGIRVRDLPITLDKLIS